MLEQLVALVTTIFQYYIIVMLLLFILVASGLLYWQRQHPVIRKVLQPFSSFYQRISGQTPNFALQSSRIQSEMPLYNKARKLQIEIKGILKENKRISSEKKQRISSQTDSLLNNIVDLLKRLDTVRRLTTTLDGTDQAEMEKIDFSLQLQIERSVETLQALPIGLVKVEMASEERSIDRLIDDLSETNDSIHDLADSYRAIQRLSQS